MSSKICGTVRIIRNEIPAAAIRRCPCSNRCLNLSTAKVCQNHSIRNAFGRANEIVHFFQSSSKRNFVLRTMIPCVKLGGLKNIQMFYRVLTGLPEILDTFRLVLLTGMNASRQVGQSCSTTQ